MITLFYNQSHFIYKTGKPKIRFPIVKKAFHIENSEYEFIFLYVYFKRKLN
jgi:hypothetical protein